MAAISFDASVAFDSADIQFDSGTTTSVSVTVTPAVVLSFAAVPATFPQLNRLIQPLVASTPENGHTVASPVNDGRTSAEKRTTA